MSIVALVNDVSDYLAAAGVGCNVLFGRNERAKQMNQGAGQANRVVFQPGDDSGKFGRIATTHQPGMRSIHQRSIANFEALMIVSVWAAYKIDPNNEREQMCAAEDLLEWVMRAMQDLRPGLFEWGAVQITPPSSERIYGLELRAELAYKFPFLSRPANIVTPSGVVHKDPQE